MSTFETNEFDNRSEPQQVVCTDTQLIVTLKDGREIATPLWWYPRLLNATPEQRTHYQLMRTGIHWPDVDEDLSIRGMLQGKKAPGATQPEPVGQ